MRYTAKLERAAGNIDDSNRVTSDDIARAKVYEASITVAHAAEGAAPPWFANAVAKVVNQALEPFCAQMQTAVIGLEKLQVEQKKTQTSLAALKKTMGELKTEQKRTQTGLTALRASVGELQVEEQQTRTIVSRLEEQQLKMFNS